MRSTRVRVGGRLRRFAMAVAVGVCLALLQAGPVAAAELVPETGTAGNPQPVVIKPPPPPRPPAPKARKAPRRTVAPAAPAPAPAVQAPVAPVPAPGPQPVLVQPAPRTVAPQRVSSPTAPQLGSALFWWLGGAAVALIASHLLGRRLGWRLLRWCPPRIPAMRRSTARWGSTGRWRSALQLWMLRNWSPSS